MLILTLFKDFSRDFYTGGIFFTDQKEKRIKQNRIAAQRYREKIKSDEITRIALLKKDAERKKVERVKKKEKLQFDSHLRKIEKLKVTERMRRYRSKI